MLTFAEFEEQHCKGCIDLNETIRAWHKYFRDNATVGDGATICLWSDRHAYTIVKRSPKSLTLRRCKCIRDFTPEWISLGGFSAFCTNNEEQKWKYEEDENGRTIRVFWSEKYGMFRHGTSNVIPGRHEFYDYNF